MAGNAKALTGAVAMIANASNHQLTYDSLTVAFKALKAFLQVYGGFQISSLDIVDGEDQAKTESIEFD